MLELVLEFVVLVLELAVVEFDVLEFVVLVLELVVPELVKVFAYKRE
mgnify:CR=1 FL=1